MYKNSNEEHEICLQCDNHPDVIQNILVYVKQFADEHIIEEQA